MKEKNSPNFIKVNKQNIGGEHICCAFRSKAMAKGYSAKKAWLESAFDKGYVFHKLDVKGKVFIEYVPIEASWLPLSGKDFLVINCFWVSGRFKGQGHGKALLELCKEAAEGKGGLVAITGEKKRPFMSDPRFLENQGFELIDSAPPFFRLWGKRLQEGAAFPKFLPSAKAGRSPYDEGLTVYYSYTCPFTLHYVEEVLQSFADKRGIPLRLIRIDSQKKGQAMPIPWIIHSVFYKGEFLTVKIQTETQLAKLFDKKGW